jgi:hypothetical protein
LASSSSSCHLASTISSRQARRWASVARCQLRLRGAARVRRHANEALTCGAHACRCSRCPLSCCRAWRGVGRS